MVDLQSAIIFCASSPLMIKVLGPTAEYFGKGLHDITKKRVENLTKIFQKAEKKLNRRGSQKGSVPPRVLKYIMNEGSYVDNELTSEYFSGVLASSKSTISRDDRGISFLKKLSEMSNYEIRMHYILYSTYRQVFIDSKAIYLGQVSIAESFKVFIPINSLIKALALENGENISEILEHTIPLLRNRGFIGRSYLYGSKEYIQKENSRFNDAGLITSPSLLGAQLFLAAHGYIKTLADVVFDSQLKLENLDEITPCREALCPQLTIKS